MSNGIDKLIHGAEQRKVVYGNAILRKVEADLKKVLAAVDAGKPVPSRAVLANFFNEEYGLSITRHTVSNWIDNLRTGRSLCR